MTEKTRCFCLQLKRIVFTVAGAQSHGVTVTDLRCDGKRRELKKTSNFCSSGLWVCNFYSLVYGSKLSECIMGK